MCFGVLVALSTGRYSYALPLWFAPFFALRFLDTAETSPRTRLKLIYLCMWIALSVSWFGATPIWGVAHFVFMAVNALFSVMPYVVYRILVPRTRGTFASTLVFPAAVTAVEWLAVFGSPFGSFGAEAYSQVGFTPVLQIVSVTGMLGLTFLLTWPAAVAAWVWRRKRDGLPWTLGAYAAGAVVGIIILSGFLRIHQAPGIIDAAPGTEAQVSIAGITVRPTPIHELMPLLTRDTTRFRETSTDLHAAYLAASRAAAENGASLIVWPEAAGIGTFSDVELLLSSAAELARTHGVYLLVPTMSLDPEGERQALNRATLYSPEGVLTAEHVKFGGNFMEGTVAGAQSLTFADTSFGRIAIAICWDADFPAVVREAGRNGTDLLLVPARDWDGIDPLHGHMTMLRGVENGMTILRQADSGYSLVSDPWGRIVADVRGPAQLLEATIWVRSRRTLYPRTGDLVGILSFLGILTGAVWCSKTVRVKHDSRSAGAARRSVTAGKITYGKEPYRTWITGTSGSGIRKNVGK